MFLFFFFNINLNSEYLQLKNLTSTSYHCIFSKSKFGKTKSDLQKALNSAEALEVFTLDKTLAVSPEHRCEQSSVTPRETALSSAAASWHRKLCAQTLQQVQPRGRGDKLH